jgi:hypothetical protein
LPTATIKLTRAASAAIDLELATLVALWVRTARSVGAPVRRRLTAGRTPQWRAEGEVCLQRQRHQLVDDRLQLLLLVGDRPAKGCGIFLALLLGRENIRQCRRSPSHWESQRLEGGV